MNATPAPAELQFNLPKQLRDQIAAADALRGQIEAGPTPEVPAAPQPAPPARAEPQPGTPEPLRQETPPAGSEDDLSLEQRYRSLQGRHDAALRANNALSERMNSLETMLATLQAQGGTTPEPAAPTTRARLLTEQEEADYGEDMLSVVGKKAREEITPEIEQLANRLKQIESRVEGVTQINAMTAQEKMYDTLNTKAPAWEEINVSQAFKDWLAVPDPLSGRKRHDMLTEAFNRQETGRVVSFFQGFAEATGLPLNPSSPDPSAPPTNSGSGKLSLESLAAPGRARSAPDHPATPEKPIYSQAWIAKFYADVRVGKYKGREADVAATEADIFRAQHEGRIQ